MDKSRSRHSDIAIIDLPELKSPLRQTLEGGGTVSLWLGWLYMIFPILLTVILWAGGVYFIDQSLVQRGQLAELRMVLKNGGVAALVILVIHSLWISYNYYFIHGRLQGRRKERLKLPPEAMALYFNMEPAALERARGVNCLHVGWQDSKFTILQAQSISASPVLDPPSSLPDIA